MTVILYGSLSIIIGIMLYLSFLNRIRVFLDNGEAYIAKAFKVFKKHFSEYSVNNLYLRFATIKKFPFRKLGLSVLDFTKTVIEEQLLGLFIVFLIVTMPLFPELSQRVPEPIVGVYSMLVIFLWIYGLITYAKTTVKGTSKFGRYGKQILAFIIQILVGWLYIATTLSNFEFGAVSFSVVIMCILLFLIPLLTFMKVAIDSENNFYVTMFIAISTFIIVECYIFLNFGVYNLSHNGWVVESVENISQSELLLKILLLGTKYVFQAPDPFEVSNITYFIQFFIGFIINVIIVGFFISYLSSAFSKDLKYQQSEELNNHRE
ncbi:MAG: hypothetical protein K0R93_2047 [Anaerosolibacter sp.]|jgi:hypothetical protein|uniref:hypothetical protein n=1 Tax=Anaerosolibacter sp. TaxID=1872527 RepID=UPI00263649F8|nr:hypothetical protein [Anaerosolibacter sp.]MDF2547149.1 hypothetical protein [Anaerosolibacter sp.]